MTDLAPAVLLVEQDIVVRHPLAEYLRQCGFTVFEAANGDEARAALQAGSVRIDVVLADIATPGSGFGLRQWIQDHGIAVEIVLAGSLEKAVDKAGAICNDGPALAKPYEHHLVLDRIRQLIAARDRKQP